MGKNRGDCDHRDENDYIERHRDPPDLEASALRPRSKAFIIPICQAVEYFRNMLESVHSYLLD